MRPTEDDPHHTHRPHRPARPDAPRESDDLAPGDLSEPVARPSSYVWLCLLALVLIGVILLVAILWTDPEDRQPLPATPPSDAQTTE